MAKKANTPRERRLLAEYAARNWSNYRVIFNPRLGPVPLEVSRHLPPNVSPKALSSFRRYPDALVGMPNSVLMVEAKLIASGAAIGMLEEYLLLWAQTNDYGPLHALPVQGAILTAFVDPYAKQLAESHAFQWLTFAPPWIMEDLMSSEYNLTPPVIPGMASTTLKS